MTWISIHHAHEYWQSHRALTHPPADLDDAEIFILSGRPTTNQDAACILDVVCANGGDGRCDGLDHAALERLRRFLVAA